MAKAVGGDPRIAGRLGEDEGALQHALDVEGEAGGRSSRAPRRPRRAAAAMSASSVRAWPTISRSQAARIAGWVA